MSKSTCRYYKKSWFEGCVECVVLPFFGPRNWEMRILFRFGVFPITGLRTYVLQVRTKEKSDYRNNHDKVLACFTKLDMVVYYELALAIMFSGVRDGKCLQSLLAGMI